METSQYGQYGTSSHTSNKGGYFTIGDINGFLGIIADNLAQLSIIGLILGGFGFPKEIILYRIIPGIFSIICIGNLAISYMSYLVAKKANRKDITAMPYGMDTPTSISLAILVVGPTFLTLKASGMDPHSAGMIAWYTGMATVACIGILKIIGSLFANLVFKLVPTAGLLGSLAGIGIMIGILSLEEMFRMPLVGMLALGVVLYTLVAGIKWPKHLPGVLIGFVACALIYHFVGGTDIGSTPHLDLGITLSFPHPSWKIVEGLKYALPLFPIFLPFAILVMVGDINVTASAIQVGDPYNPKHILLLDGVVTLLGAVCGSITQTTAYAGQTAYKRMGARMGYTIYSAIFMGIFGFAGIVSLILNLVPSAIFASILFFVALEIVAQAFYASPKHHYTAVAFASFPSAMKPILIMLTSGAYIGFDKLLSMQSSATDVFPNITVLAVLVNGFILTGMLWGGLLAEIIDRKINKAYIYIIILAICTFFGIIHSTNLNGGVYLPWHLSKINQAMVYNLTGGYILIGIFLFLVSFSKSSIKSKTSGKIVLD